MNKLGFYVQVSTTPGLREAINQVQPPTILWHAGDRGFLQEIRKHRSPGSFVIGRWYLDQNEQRSILESSDPAQAGRNFAQKILTFDLGYATERVEGRLLVDAWMTLNEPFRGPAAFASGEVDDEFKRFAAAYDKFQVAFRQVLVLNGIEAVAFNFAAGNFTQPDHYLNWFPQTLASYIYLGFHEYGWPTLMPDASKGTESSATFYRRCMEAIRKKHGDQHRVIITEAGLARMYKHRADGAGDVGWLWPGETIPENQYWDSLAWYNAEMCKDPYVFGACLYQVGNGGKNWETFRHLGVDNDSRQLTLINRMAGLRDQNQPFPVLPTPIAPKPPPAPTPTPTPVPSPGPAPAPLPPVPTDPAGVKKRVLETQAKLAPLPAQLTTLAQASGWKQTLDNASKMMAQMTAYAQTLAELQARLGRLQAELAVRPNASPDLRRTALDLAAQLSTLQQRVQGITGLSANVTTAQNQLTPLAALIANASSLQKQVNDWLVQVGKLLSELGVPSNASSIALQNPAPGIRISQVFGANPQSYASFGLAGHEGIDYATPLNTGVRAAADGIVHLSGQTTGAYGTRVILVHKWGTQQGFTIYAHLNTINVQVGAQVKSGDVVGKSGNTGNSTGPHLHFSLLLTGVKNEGYPSKLGATIWYHNPAPYMTGRDAPDWSVDAPHVHEG